jgi:homoserine O-succinyltransferase
VLDILRPGEGRARPASEPRALRCAFVNNMPDSAFAATERQFLGLLDAGSGPVALDVSRYSFEALPRGERVAALQAGEYFALDELWESDPDIVIVTGSEPLADTLDAEPYWPESARLAAWAEGRSVSLLLSCLAAHLILFAFYGIPRRKLAAKCTGVFAHEIDGSSPLTESMSAPVLMPHSRLNDVRTDLVEGAGLDVVLSSPAVGWSVVTGRRAGCDLLLLQGHPEYDPTSLLREYRRDAGRYLRSERPGLPVLPLGCVGPDDAEAIESFQRRVLSGGPDPALLDAFDFEGAADRAPWPWREASRILYRNWVAGVAAQAPDRAGLKQTG